MRQELEELKPLQSYGLFARSMVSNRDAMLLRGVARETSSSDVAGRVFLELLTMGGMGCLTADMFPWLRRDEDDSDLLVQIGIVLAALVRDVADGTALRALFQFRYHEDIRRNLERITDELSEERIAALFRMSLVEQVADRINTWGEHPGSRGLWLLRTYIDMPTVQEYLTQFIALGSLAALTSYFFTDKIIAWAPFDLLKYNEPYERRIAINLAAENVARGGSVGDLRQTLYFQSLSTEERRELLEGLSS